MSPCPKYFEMSLIFQYKCDARTGEFRYRGDEKLVCKLTDLDLTGGKVIVPKVTNMFSRGKVDIKVILSSVSVHFFLRHTV